MRPACELINAMYDARKVAETETSKLCPEALAIEGMIAPRFRHFLNAICSRVSTYLEIGTYKGASLVAASAGNPALLAVGVDVFQAAFGHTEKETRATLQRLAPHARLYTGSFYDYRPEPSFRADVFYYDGDHTPVATRDALSIYCDYLADDSVVIIDDFDWHAVQAGTWAGFAAMAGKGLVRLESLHLIGDPSGSAAPVTASQWWWNGALISYFKRR